MKFRKKPIVIEAIRFDGTPKSACEVFDAFDIPGGKYLPNFSDLSKDGRISIMTLEGELTASPGDWIICGVKGEFYPIKPDILMETYDAEPEGSEFQGVYGSATPIRFVTAPYITDRVAGCFPRGTRVVAFQHVDEKGEEIHVIRTINPRTGKYHLSISRADRLPSWAEVHHARYSLVPDDRMMAMMLPPRRDYVNIHPFCFQLTEVEKPDIMEPEVLPNG